MLWRGFSRVEFCLGEKGIGGSGDVGMEGLGGERAGWVELLKEGRTELVPASENAY